MKETGMLFNGAMVRALLDGRKTQTRRIIKDQPRVTESRLKELGAWNPDLTLSQHVNQAFQSGFVDVKCPFGQVGDRIWVRETWSPDFAHHYPHDRCWYAADDNRKWDIEVRNGTRGIWSPESNTFVPFKWHPSIHMPRWASRILLEITEVRIERLQDISESDAAAEGARTIECDHIRHSCEEIGCYGDTAKAAFRGIWESTGGDWDANPWVWVIEFKQIETGAAA